MSHGNTKLVISLDAEPKYTHRAYRVIIDGQTHFMPKSQCSYRELRGPKGKVYELTLPRWLAEHREIEQYCEEK